MRVLHPMGADLSTRKYRESVKIYACILMSLFLVSCVDGLSLPDFPQIKKRTEDKTVSPEGEELFAATPVKKIKTEKLLDEEGNWNIVEKSEAIDPMQAHLAARNEVDVRRRKKKKELSAHFKPDAKSGEDGKVRVLRLEAGSGGIKDHEIAGSSVTKPMSKVTDSHGIIIPERKPVIKTELTRKQKPVKKTSGTEYFSAKKPTSSEERMVNGYIIPPILPQRKYAQASVVSKSKEVAIVKPEPRIVKKGVVIPQRKPWLGFDLTNNKARSIIVPEKKPKMDRGDKETEDLVPSSAIRLRSGRHPGRTRLVIEVTRPTRYKVAIDHVRNVLRVKLSDTQWKLSPQETFTKSGLLGTYIAREQADGSTILEIRLKKKTKILDTMVLRPNLSSKHRVVIDLKD